MTINELYIPVWIDLKIPPGVNYEQNILPLHSSMDRFKVFSLFHYFALLILYIPVWIDLKEVIAAVNF